MNGKRFEFIQRDTGITKTIGKSLFTAELEETIRGEEIVMLPVDQIDEMKDILHPFSKSMYKGVEELAALINAAGGIQQPAVVRQKSDGRYEILIGRRRRMAAILLHMETIPAVIRNVDDTEAKLIITDNLGQRPKIYPSERAMAYQLEMDALKQQGKQREFEGAAKEFLEKHFVHNVPEVLQLEAREIIAKLHQESPRTISYYLRLNDLVPELIELVDEEKIALRAGVELSYLRRNEQRIVSELLEEYPEELSVALAHNLRERSQHGELDRSEIIAILLPSKQPVGRAVEKPIYQRVLKQVTKYCKTLDEGRAERLSRVNGDELEQLLIQTIEQYLQRESSAEDSVEGEDV